MSDSYSPESAAQSIKSPESASEGGTQERPRDKYQTRQIDSHRANRRSAGDMNSDRETRSASIPGTPRSSKTKARRSRAGGRGRGGGIERSPLAGRVISRDDGSSNGNNERESDIEMLSPSPSHEKPRPMARRARRNPVSSSSASIASSRPAHPPSPSSARGGRPSGPLISSRLGQRRSSRRSSSPVQEPETSRSAMQPNFIMDDSHNQFPSFRACARLNGFTKPSEPQQFFDCKFYPYTKPGVDPVFAFVGGSEIGIARPSLDNDEGLDIIAWLHEEAVRPINSKEDATGNSDEDEPVRASVFKRGGARAQGRAKRPDPVDLNSCAWMQHPVTKAPLLAVTGKPSAIKIIDIFQNKAIEKFVGHGREVNDLAVSPINSSILASASGDHTVRIWTLEKSHKTQPCILMCAGEGHKQGLLTLAFHQTGRYLLTGGVDNAICLWVLPDLPPNQVPTDKPTTLHYPHFRSASIHTNFVDCVAFHHDLIISKCARENKIVIWRIEGFDSRREPPSKPPSVAEDLPTRSAWGGKFQRLTQFDVSDMSAFYIRFSLFSFPGERPVLAIGNERSKVFFWDLKSLEEWTRPDPTLLSGEQQAAEASSKRGPRGGRPRRRARARMMPQFRDSSVVSDQSNAKADGLHAGALGFGTVDGGNRLYWAKRLQMDDPFKVLEPHRTSTIQKVFFACRQVAWSVGGEWMVVVGDQGMLGIFHRDRPNGA